MAFENEHASEPDKQAIDFSVIKRPPLLEQSVNPYLWTVDRDRQVFLMRTLSGGPDDPDVEHVALWIKGEVVHAMLKWHFDEKQKELLVWQLIRIRIPESLQKRRSDVLQLLREALEAFGTFYARRSGGVRFEF